MQVQFVFMAVLHYVIPVVLASPLKPTLESPPQRQGQTPEQMIAAKNQLVNHIDPDHRVDTHNRQRTDPRPAVVTAAAVLGVAAIHKSRHISSEMDEAVTLEFEDAVRGLQEDNDPELDDCVIKEVSY